MLSFYKNYGIIKLYILVWRKKMKLKIASYNISGGFYEDDQSGE